MAKTGIRRILRLRWIVYAALIVYFGVQALRRYVAAEDAASPPPNAAEEPLGPGGIKPTRYYTMPDGQKAPVYEVTPEEAERHFGVKRQADAQGAEAGAGAKGDSASTSGTGSGSGSGSESH